MSDKDMDDVKSPLGIELHDIPAAFGLLTRVPVPIDHDRAGERGAATVWAYPLVGLVVGAVAGLVVALTHWFGAPASLAAVFGLLVLVTLTGGLHEDGLADCADGFGGGNDKDRRLDIMKDSRIGAFGAIALILVLIGRWSGVEVLSGWYAIPALAGVGAASRLPMVLAMYILPNARPDGLSARVGKPQPLPVSIAIVLTAVLCLLTLGWTGIFVMIWAILIAAPFWWVAHRMIGGQTGDVLGGTQQLAELAALAALAASLG